MKNKEFIFISGSTHGIGYACTRRFLEEGYHVWGCSHNKEDPRIAFLKDIGREKGDGLYHHTICDISKQEDVEKMFSDIFKEGYIRFAFNCAGTGCIPSAIFNSDDSEVIRVIHTNLLGVYYLMKQELLHMQNHGIHGTILNCGSIAASTAGTGADWSYSASKAGIAALTKEAHLKVKDIQMLLLTPGYIETRMTCMDDKTKHAYGSPFDVAELVFRVATELDFVNYNGEFTIIGNEPYTFRRF